MFEVNGRHYKLPTQPTVVVCVDGCEPDYLAQLFGRDGVGQLAAHCVVQHRAQVKNVHRFLQRNVAHKHTAVFFLPHQARLFEHAKRFAHRPA